MCFRIQQPNAAQLDFPGRGKAPAGECRGPDDLDLAAAVRRELRNETHVSGRGGQPLPDAIFVDGDEMPGAIRIGGTYLLEDRRITAQIWLSRDKAKTHVVVEGSADDIPSLATKITATILDAGKRL